MPASFSDQGFLANDTQFQTRVRQALITTISSIQNEAVTVASRLLHNARVTQCAVIMQPSAIDSWKIIFAEAIATDANVLADATAGGTVVLTAANAAAQAALVTDAHISTAASSQFNSFLNFPS